MKSVKQYFLRIFFVGEIALFVFLFIFSSKGLCAIWALGRESESIKKKSMLVQNHVCQLQKDIVEWSESSFHKERLAREQLQMARRNDRVYYVS